jgi:hypothetical protein
VERRMDGEARTRRREEVMLKSEYPKAISDLLGIAAQDGIAGPWMSSEGTVLRSWLLAIGESLDVPYTGEKSSMMRALVEAVGGTWDPVRMSSTETTSGGGGNISTPAFEALYAGIEQRMDHLPLLDSTDYETPFHPVQPPDRRDDSDGIVAIRIRRGQPQFRAMLLEAYGGRCAVTRCDAVPALEAAHVIPYGQGGTYDLRNGLLLRADIHSLLDQRRLSFDSDRRVCVHPFLMDTEFGAALDGLPVHDPASGAEAVPDDVFAWHRSTCEF